MVMVKKNLGNLEQFNIEKIRQSIILAGGSEMLAREVASHVPQEEKVRTGQIREKVFEELWKRNKQAAMNYYNTLTLFAFISNDAPIGIVKIHLNNFFKLKILPDSVIDVIFQGNKQQVIAHPGALSRRNIRLNEVDIKRLGVKESTKVIIQRKPMLALGN